MNRIKLTARLLNVRMLLKRLNQLSWTVQRLDNQFPHIDKMTLEDQKELLKVYFGLMDEFMNIYESFTHERNNK